MTSVQGPEHSSRANSRSGIVTIYVSARFGFPNYGYSILPALDKRTIPRETICDTPVMRNSKGAWLSKCG